MINLKIKELLLSLGHQRPGRWLMTNCGFSRTKASKLVNAKQKSLSMEDIAILCEKIPCLPNDFFYWKTSLRHKLAEGHPLQQLTPPDGNEDWNKVLKKLSPETIAELRKIAIGSIKKKKEVKDKGK